MTEEMGGTQVPEPEMPDEAAVEAPAAPRQSTASTPESMMMLGAMIIIGGWLLFSIILDEYGTNWTALVLSLFIVMSTVGDRTLFPNLAPRSTLLKVSGYAIAVFAVLELIWDLRFAGGVLDEFVEILGALALLGGSALVFMGARSIED